GAIVEIGGQLMNPQERRNVEADAPSIRVPIESQGVLGRLKRATSDHGRGFLRGADIIAQWVALAKHTKVEGADVAEETIEILGANRIADEGAGAFGNEKLVGRRRRNEIFHAD